MGKRKDLTERERYQIEAFLKDKKSIRQIADLLNRHYMTIYREIRRGTVSMLGDELAPIKKYCADRGQDIANERKHHKGREFKVSNDLAFIRFCEKMILEERYSPCAVLAYIRNQNITFRTNVCYTTLYSYIDKGLLLNVTNKDLPIRSRRKKHNIKKVRSVSLTNLKGRSIEDRPNDILMRGDYGHWEMDTVVGKQGGDKDCLLVLTERKTRNEYIIKMPDKSQDSVVKALDCVERAYGFDSFRENFKTITIDNGTEFLNMIGIERSLTRPGCLRTTAYYCHPYCSHERGSNENQNRMIRRWVPKGIDISQYDNEYIQKVQTWLNTYPRKLFGWKSSSGMLKLETI